MTPHEARSVAVPRDMRGPAKMSTPHELWIQAPRRSRTRPTCGSNHTSHMARSRARCADDDPTHPVRRPPSVRRTYVLRVGNSCCVGRAASGRAHRNGASEWRGQNECSSSPPQGTRATRRRRAPAVRSLIRMLPGGQRDEDVHGDDRPPTRRRTEARPERHARQIYLPGVVPRGSEITIRQLLQHRSGLVNYTDYRSCGSRAQASHRRPGRSTSVRFAGSKLSGVRSRHPVEVNLEHELHRTRPRHREGHRTLVCRRARAATSSYRSGLSTPSCRRRHVCQISAMTPSCRCSRALPKAISMTWIGPIRLSPRPPADRLERSRPVPLLFGAPLRADPLRALPSGAMKKTVAAGTAGEYGLGIVSIDVRCGERGPWRRHPRTERPLRATRRARRCHLCLRSCVNHTARRERTRLPQEYRLASSGASLERIAVVRERGGHNTALSVVNVDGSGPRRLSRGKRSLLVALRPQDRLSLLKPRRPRHERRRPRAPESLCEVALLPGHLMAA